MSPRRKRRSREPSPRESTLDLLYPTLDLHGLSGAEAERTAERWLEDRRREGERVVRIVTGKGMHSVGLPILPGLIEDLLHRRTGTSVESFDREPGGGAVRVTLRRPEPAPAAVKRRSRYPPEVVRAAEEALADLGIDPIPELVEAEVRRILGGPDAS